MTFFKVDKKRDKQERKILDTQVNLSWNCLQSINLYIAFLGENKTKTMQNYVGNFIKGDLE